MSKQNLEAQSIRLGKWIEIEKYGLPETKLNNKPTPYYESKFLLIYSPDFEHPVIAKYQHGTTGKGFNWKEWSHDQNAPYAYQNVTHWLEYPPIN